MCLLNGLRPHLRCNPMQGDQCWLILLLRLNFVIWHNPERVRRGSYRVWFNLSWTARQFCWLELQRCFESLDFIFNFLLRLRLFVLQSLEVQLVLFTQTLSNVRILSHLHVRNGQLVFLHGCQFLFVCTLCLLFCHNKIVGLVEII